VDLLQNTNILKYRDGKFELGHDEAEFGITSMGKRRNGSALFASLVYGALTYNDAKFAILTSSSRDAQNSLARAPAETVDNHSSRLSWASSVASHRSADRAPRFSLSAKLPTEESGWARRIRVSITWPKDALLPRGKD